MTLFRYTNGLLYMIYRCTPRACLGVFYEAHPYKHNVEIGLQRGNGRFGTRGRMFKGNMKLSDFTPVATA